MTDRRPSRLVPALLLAGLAWLAFAALVVPWLIRGAYAGTSIPLLNDVLAGRSVHPVEFYLDAWRGVARTVTLVGLVSGAVAAALIRFPDVRRRVARWALGRGGELGVGEVAWYAVGVGFLGGLSEQTYRAVRHLVTHRPAAGFFWDHLWMAPLAAMVASLVVALVMLGVARVGPTRMGFRSATFVLWFPAVYGVVQSEGIPLHSSAEVVLALGLAAGLTRFLAAREETVRALLPRARYALVGAAGALVVFAALRTPAVGERMAMRGAPEAGDGLPNILLVILDTVRADHVGAYGYDRNTTPHLDRWALEGAVFERAYATAPWTLPSHATMFTGRYPWELGAGVNAPLDDTWPTIAEVLASRGYATAGFVANLGYTSPSSGLSRGFGWYQSIRITVGQAAWSSWLSSALARPLNAATGIFASGKIGTHVTTEFVSWLDRPRDRPFFAFLNYFDAHDPYKPPEPYYSLHGAPWGMGNWNEFSARWERTRREGATPPVLDDWIARYDGGVSYVDHQLGRLLEALEARDLKRNTLVIITSDHGEHWGEHGLLEHGNSLYEEALRVPLIIAFEGRVPAGARVSRAVTLRDLPATILSLASLDEDSPFPGSALYPPAPPHGGPSPSPLLAELSPPQVPGEMRSLMEGPHHYIVMGDGTEELYDLSADTEREERGERRGSLLGRFRARLAGLGPDGRVPSDSAEVVDARPGTPGGR